MKTFLFYAGCPTFKHDGRGVFEGVSISSNEFLSGIKRPNAKALVYTINDYYHMFTPGLKDVNPRETAFNFSREKAFTLTFSEFIEGEIITMKYELKASAK